MPVTRSHALYRFFAGEELLYVGKTMRLPERWKAHSKDKEWWAEVTNCTVEHFPDAPSLGQAEIDAIRDEHPRYNIMYNQAESSRKKRNNVVKYISFSASPAHEEQHYGDVADPQALTGWTTGWTFKNRESGRVFTCRELWLYPELECSAEVESYPNAVQFRRYVDYLRRNHPEWLETDAVPIYWTVRSTPDDIYEAAPFQFTNNWDYCCGDCEDCTYDHFLTWYTSPTDTETGEPMNWYQLPVRNERFPAFARALRWTPSPLQPYCPLASILAGGRSKSRT